MKYIPCQLERCGYNKVGRGENVVKYIPSIETITSGMLGKAVGDALGVPAEFASREALRRNPVNTMLGDCGAHDKPVGTWSDDTSMAIAAMASIADEGHVDYEKIMDYFVRWIDKGHFTTDGDCFDNGRAVGKALGEYKRGVYAIDCGVTGEKESGNGSLMRIFPFAMYYANGLIKGDIDAIEMVALGSAITHSQFICREICIIYSTVLACFAAMADGYNKFKMVDEFDKYKKLANDEKKLEGMEAAKNVFLSKALKLGYDNAAKYADKKGKRDLESVILPLKNIENIMSLNENDEQGLPSGGYVLDSFRAAIWCFIKTDNYKDCLLKAVNLGGDTDTTAAIVGALAGVYYKESGIPEEWLNATLRIEDIKTTCARFEKAIGNDMKAEAEAGEDLCTMAELWNPRKSKKISNGAEPIANKQAEKKRGFFAKLFRR